MRIALRGMERSFSGRIFSVCRFPALAQSVRCTDDMRRGSGCEFSPRPYAKNDLMSPA